MIAAAGAAMASDRGDPYPVLRIDDEPAHSRPGTSLSNAPTVTSMPQVPEKTTLPDSTSYSATTRRVERMQSVKSRRDHSHHPSHSSRHHKDDQKTVGEYALHVLFTSVRPLSKHRMVSPR